MNVGLGPPVATAPFLGVVDRHLPDVARDRERQFPSGVRDAEDGVGERGPLVRSPYRLRTAGSNAQPREPPSAHDPLPPCGSLRISSKNNMAKRERG